MKLLSTEAEGVNIAIPEADRPMLVNSAGRVGALLGLKSPEEGSALCTHDDDLTVLAFLCAQQHLSTALLSAKAVY